MDIGKLFALSTSYRRPMNSKLWPDYGSTSYLKRRKTNFTGREVEALLSAVARKRDAVLLGITGGHGWAEAWQEVASEVSKTEGIFRSANDVRKKWTYLKWEAKNTSKPSRDLTSRTVLEILANRERATDTTLECTNGFLRRFLVPHKSNSSPAQIKIGSPIVLTTQDPLATPKVSPTKIVTPSSTVRVSTPTPVVVPSRPVSTASSDSTSSGPEVYLRWDSYNNNMRNMFPTLLSSERFVDVTLACEGQSVKCHKFMLSACSPYFDKLLGENPCRHPIVLLKDLQFWEVQAILDFIYKGEVKVSQEKLPSLLAAAECLQIKGLSESSLSTPWWNESSNENSSSKPKHSEREKKTKKRKSHQQYISELKESGSVDDSNSETSEDETSRLIVVGNKVDEADSTSSSIPTTNGIVLKKIKLESSRPSVKEESESIKKENHVGSKNPGSSVKKKSSMSGPPNLIKIEHSQYPISTKTELDDASYDEDWKDDGSSSPNYYPAYPEAIVDTVLTEEDSSNQ